MRLHSSPADSDGQSSPAGIRGARILFHSVHRRVKFGDAPRRCASELQLASAPALHHCFLRMDEVRFYILVSRESSTSGSGPVVAQFSRFGLEREDDVKKLAFSLFGLLFLIWLAGSAFGEPTGTLIGKAGLQPLPPNTKIVDFTLDGLNVTGNSINLSAYQGKVVLLTFFATWCGPCRSEMPDIESIYTKFKDRGFDVVAVDLAENASAASSYAHQLGLTFPIALDTTGRIGLAYGARAIPTSYLIDRSGDVVAGTIGAHSWTGAGTEALIKALLVR